MGIGIIYLEGGLIVRPFIKVILVDSSLVPLSFPATGLDLKYQAWVSFYSQAPNPIRVGHSCSIHASITPTSLVVACSVHS